MSARSPDPRDRPVTDCASSTSAASVSAAYSDGLPASAASIRSSPAPVSTFRAGRSVSDPSGFRKNCVNTRFQISTKRCSAAGSAGPPSGPCSGP